MERHTVTPDARGTGSTPPPERDGRHWRLVPPAITPVTVADVGVGVVNHLRHRGRDQFREQVESFLDAESSSTYTSFRRTLADCFLELNGRDSTDRREVLIPAFCSSDFPDAIRGVDLDPVRYDIDHETLAPDLDSLDTVLGPDTLAVVSINVLGYGSNMPAIADRCDEYDAILVEALGYALGTTYNDQLLGTFGDCAVLNFQQGKPIPVGGGMMVSQTPAIECSDTGRPQIEPNVAALTGYAVLSRPYAYHAYSTVQQQLERAGLWGDRVTTHPEHKFDVEYTAPFATLSDFQGAVATRVFQRLEDNRRHRAATAQFYTNELSNCPGLDLLEAVDGLSNLQHVRFPILVETEPLRDSIQEALREHGIQATTLYDWPVLDPDTVPGAARLQRGILTLPTHPYVDDRDRSLVVDTVRRVARTHSERR